MTNAADSVSYNSRFTTPVDMRSFLDRLRRERRLVRISTSVLPEPDVQGFCRAATEVRSDATALEFDNIYGYPERRLVLNLLGSWSNCALLLGLPAVTPMLESIRELCRRADCNTDKPVWVEDAPCCECTETGEIDLNKILPLFRVNENDAGLYLHRACVAFEDDSTPPGHNRTKIGMYPLEVQGRDRLGIHSSGVDDLSNQLAFAAKMNCPLPVAVCLGVPPIVSVGASTAIGYQTSQYDLISALSGHSLQLARGPHSHLSIPANCEFLFEGYLEPRMHPPEGTLSAEQLKMSDRNNQHQIKVTGIYHRRDPILDNAYVGSEWTESDCIAGMSAALRIHRQEWEIVAEVARSGRRADGAHLRFEFCNLQRETMTCNYADATQLNLQPYRQQIEALRRDKTLSYPQLGEVRNEIMPATVILSCDAD